jgi:hypothetical protein
VLQEIELLVRGRQQKILAVVILNPTRGRSLTGFWTSFLRFQKNRADIPERRATLPRNVVLRKLRALSMK